MFGSNPKKRKMNQVVRKNVMNRKISNAMKAAEIADATPKPKKVKRKK